MEKAKLKDLYDQKLVMYRAKKMMEEQLRLVGKDKEFLVDLICLKKLDVSRIKETFSKYRKKAVDPNNSPNRRARFERLASEYEKLLLRFETR